MISIIIPTKNEENYLPSLLNSIKNQTYKDYEIIIADNNSLDKTKSIARKFGCKVVKGGPPSKARNNGAKAAKSDLLFFIDADFSFDKDFLKKSIRELKKRSIGVATCRIYPESKLLFDKIFFFILNTLMFIEQYFWPNSGGCIFCKKTIHKNIGGFNENLYVAEDCDYVKRASQFKKFRFLKTSVTVSVRRFDSTGRLKFLFSLIFLGIQRLFGGVKKSTKLYNLDYKK